MMKVKKVFGMMLMLIALASVVWADDYVPYVGANHSLNLNGKNVTNIDRLAVGGLITNNAKLYVSSNNINAAYISAEGNYDALTVTSLRNRALYVTGTGRAEFTVDTKFTGTNNYLQWNSTNAFLGYNVMPQFPIHIKQDSNSNSRMILVENGNSQGAAVIQLKTGNVQGAVGVDGELRSQHPSMMYFFNNNDAGFVFQTTTKAFMKLSNDGLLLNTTKAITCSPGTITYDKVAKHFYGCTDVNVWKQLDQ